MGLCNFFRGHVKNFAHLSAPLTQLPRNNSGYEEGKHPEESFKDLLMTEPCLAFPRSGVTYALVTEAYLPSEQTCESLGSALCQIDKHKQCQVISYASRQLQDHDR